VEVDLDAIAENIKVIKGRLPKGTRCMAVVKADAYGHGSLPVASTAIEAGADWLGVATVDEGIELRRGGLNAPILILGLTDEGSARDIVEWDLSAAICTSREARALAHAARKCGKKAKAHLKVDTGMARIGLRRGEVAPFLQGLKAIPSSLLEIEGIFTHFANADVKDKGFALEQFARFQDIIEIAWAQGFEFPLRHIANSAAALYLPETALDMVRLGISLYGLYPEGRRDRELLTPALKFKTRVAYVKTVPAGESIGYGRTYITSEETRVATLSVGYADGYSRGLSNKGTVIIRERLVPIVGRVCMDQCMVKIPHDMMVEVGDEAILIGKQGSVELTADDIAETLGTISYEVFTAISHRVKRIYYKGGGAVNKKDSAI
jgi:alanine racemase